jgi:hypothetical protein
MERGDQMHWMRQGAQGPHVTDPRRLLIAGSLVAGPRRTRRGRLRPILVLSLLVWGLMLGGLGLVAWLAAWLVQ